MFSGVFCEGGRGRSTKYTGRSPRLYGRGVGGQCSPPPPPCNLTTWQHDQLSEQVLTFRHTADCRSLVAEGKWCIIDFAVPGLYSALQVDYQLQNANIVLSGELKQH